MRLCVLRGINDGKICIPSVLRLSPGNLSHPRASACLAVRASGFYGDLSSLCLSAYPVKQAWVE